MPVSTRQDGSVAQHNQGPELVGELIELVPVTWTDVAQLRRILATPAVRSRWGDEAASDQWPFDDPSAIRFAIVLAGAVVGMVQYGEEDDPSYRHASIDIFVEPAVHGRGIGRDAVRTLARHLIVDRGHHRLVIDPAADNVAAIHCYAAVGFRPVGVLRSYERDVEGTSWHDGLLMDLLAPELIL
jgi:RimJ/RimL family protein N-acetyltransferase